MKKLVYRDIVSTIEIPEDKLRRGIENISKLKYLKSKNNKGVDLEELHCPLTSAYGKLGAISSRSEAIIRGGGDYHGYHYTVGCVETTILRAMKLSPEEILSKIKDGEVLQPSSI